MLISELIHRHYPHESGHVTNSMEISVHHHKIVQGNVKLVMQQTGERAALRGPAVLQPYGTL